MEVSIMGKQRGRNTPNVTTARTPLTYSQRQVDIENVDEIRTTDAVIITLLLTAPEQDERRSRSEGRAHTLPYRPRIKAGGGEQSPNAMDSERTVGLQK
jgi:hypothetical protein